MSLTVCKNFACDNRECNYGRRCSFFHGRFPSNYKVTDQKLIVNWVKTTANVQFSDRLDVGRLTRSFTETNNGENNSAHAATTNANGVDQISPQT